MNYLRHYGKWITINDIVQDVGFSRRTVSKYVKQLYWEDKLLDVTLKDTKKGRSVWHYMLKSIKE